MRVRLAPRLMTLDDLELLYFLGISRDFADLRGSNGKTNEDRPVLSAMHYVDILLGVPPLGVYNRNTVSENDDFLALCVNISETVRDTSNVTIND